MLKKWETQCQQVPVLLFKFFTRHKMWYVDMYLYTHKNTQTFENIWLLSKWKTIWFQASFHKTQMKF